MTPDPPTLELEENLWARGAQQIAGIDEAGRGALAGPVAAAAVILPPRANLRQILWGVRDSKQMSAPQRETWAATIREVAVTFGVGLASVTEIEALGIAPATRLAAQRAVAALQITPDHLLIDYFTLPELSTPQTALPKGDQRSLSIAAASVLAKTTRDAILCELDAQFPAYGLAKHKGYGTAAHRAAIRQFGPCPQHRMRFEPLKSLNTPA